MMPHMLESDKKFRAESDMRTLIEAEKIKKDKNRLSAAMKVAKEQKEALNSISNQKKEG